MPRRQCSEHLSGSNNGSTRLPPQAAQKGTYAMSTTESHAEGLSTDISRRLAPERTSALHGASPGRLSGRRLDMSTDLTLFTHPVFGNLRTIVDGETIYICAKDAATALGYSNTNDNSRIHAPGKTS